MVVSESYDMVSRVLHWVSAAIILWATLSGILIAYVHVSDAAKNFIGNLNVSLTTLFIPIFVFRIYNRVKLGIPSYRGRLSTFEKRLACVSHVLLYVVTTVVLISGCLMMDRDISVFGVVEFPNMIQHEDMQQTFSFYHTASNHLLALLIVFHICAVVKHELKGVPIYKRMAFNVFKMS